MNSIFTSGFGDASSAQVNEKGRHDGYIGSHGYADSPGAALNTVNYIQGQPVQRPLSKYSSDSSEFTCNKVQMSPYGDTSRFSGGDRDSQGYQVFGHRAQAQHRQWSAYTSDLEKRDGGVPPARRPSFLDRALAHRPVMYDDTHFANFPAVQAPERVAQIKRFPSQSQQLYSQQRVPSSGPSRRVPNTPGGTLMSALGAPLHALRKVSQSSHRQPQHGQHPSQRRGWHNLHHHGAPPPLLAIESDYEGSIGGDGAEIPMARPAQVRRPVFEEDSIVATPPSQRLPSATVQVFQTPWASEGRSSADRYTIGNVAGRGASYRTVSESTLRCAPGGPGSMRGATREALDEKVLQELKRRQLQEDGKESSDERRSKRAAKINNWVTENQDFAAASPPNYASRRCSESSIAVTTSEFISVSRQASLAHGNMIRRLQAASKREEPRQPHTPLPQALAAAIFKQQNAGLLQCVQSPPLRTSSFLDVLQNWPNGDDDGGSKACSHAVAQQQQQQLPITSVGNVAAGMSTGDQRKGSDATGVSQDTVMQNQVAQQHSQVQVLDDEARRYGRRDLWMAEQTHLESDKQRLIAQQREQRRAQRKAEAREERRRRRAAEKAQKRQQMSDADAILQPEQEQESLNANEEFIEFYAEPVIMDNSEGAVQSLQASSSATALAQLQRHLALELEDEAASDIQNRDAQVRRQSTLLNLLRADSIVRSSRDFKAPVLGYGRPSVQRQNSSRCQSASMLPVNSPVAASQKLPCADPRAQSAIERARRASASALLHMRAMESLPEDSSSADSTIRHGSTLQAPAFTHAQFDAMSNGERMAEVRGQGRPTSLNTSAFQRLILPEADSASRPPPKQEHPAEAQPLSQPATADVLRCPSVASNSSVANTAGHSRLARRASIASSGSYYGSSAGNSEAAVRHLVPAAIPSSGGGRSVSASVPMQSAPFVPQPRRTSVAPWTGTAR